MYFTPFQIGGHHADGDFAVRGKEPKDEVQIYTWMDATLRELTDLVQRIPLFWMFCGVASNIYGCPHVCLLVLVRWGFCFRGIIGSYSFCLFVCFHLTFTCICCIYHQSSVGIMNLLTQLLCWKGSLGLCSCDIILLV